VLAAKAKAHEHDDLAAARPRERFQGLLRGAGLGQDLQVGPVLDQHRHARPDDRERVDQDHTQPRPRRRGRR